MNISTSDRSLGWRMLAGALWIAAGCGDPASDTGPVLQHNEAGAGAADARAARSPADVKPAAVERGKAKPADAKSADASNPAAMNDPDSGMAPADDCGARVVSRMKPCGDDPDPCGLNSGWDGDEYCLLPPPTDKGIQIHFGPKDYGDKSETDRYVTGPHEALNQSVLARVALDSDRFIGRLTVHMRPGIEHWISIGGSNDAEEGVYPDMACGDSTGPASGGFGGGHNLIYDNPPQGVAAPENEGIVRRFPGDSSACMVMYSVNLTDEPRLREAWVNLYFADEPKEPLKTGSIGMVGGLGLQLRPGEKQVLSYEGTSTEDGRIIQLFGHRRQWTPRLAAWLNDRLIYDSRQWEEAVTYNYDSITMNPPIDPDGVKDGAVSGTLPFKAGDRLRFSCFVDNTSDHPLSFTNEPEFGEMCNLWGTTVGGSISVSSSP